MMSVHISFDNLSSKVCKDGSICHLNGAITKMDQSINNIIKKEGFIKYKIEKKCVCTNGGNYLGELYEIDVKGKTKEGQDKELNIFVKMIIQGENNMKIISIPDIYRTEMFVYKELSKIFIELQDEARVPITERFKMVKSYDETNADAIIMENVVRKGFHTSYRMDVVCLKFAKLAIRELAKFHALSFVLKEKRPEYFEKRIKTMKMPYKNGEQWQGFVESMIKITMNHVDEDIKGGVEKFCIDIADRFFRNLEEESSKRCLCHNDYRPNNIMTKITNGEVCDIIPVDYQLISYGCPMQDFFFFIFLCTDQEFRRAHLSHLKELYFETMTQFLEYFDIDVNMVYPRKEFEKDYKDKMDYGLMVSILFLPFILASENDIPDVKKDEMSSINFQVDDKIDDRIRGVIKDYIEWGIL